MIWTPSKRLVVMIFGFAFSAIVFYILALFEAIKFDVQFLSAFALVETVMWLWLTTALTGLIAYENLKKQYGISGSSKAVYSSVGIVGRAILYDEVMDFEKKHPIIVMLHDLLS